MSGVPDYPLDETIDFKFTSRAFATGIPTTLAGTPVVKIYEDNSTTEITTVDPVTVDFDGITGLNHLRVVATGANGFEAGKSYHCVLSVGTVSGVSVVGEVVASFSIERSPVNWANVTAPTTTVDLSATDLQLVDTVTTYTNNTVQTGDTYALANGSAGFVAIDTVVDAIKVKTDFLPSATAGTAGGVFIAGTNAATTITTSLTTTFTGNLTGSVASVTGAVGSVTGSVGSVTAGVNLANGAVTDASLAGNMEIVFETDFAANYNTTRNAWVTNVADFVGTTIVDPFNGTVVAASVAGAVGSVTGAVGSVTGAVGSVTGNVGGNVTGSVGALTSAAITDVWATDTLTEAYATNPGDSATPAQLLHMLWSAVSEFSITSTTITSKKLDGSTTAMTFTIDSATVPTSRTRAT